MVATIPACPAHAHLILSAVMHTQVSRKVGKAATLKAAPAYTFGNKHASPCSELESLSCAYL